MKTPRYSIEINQSPEDVFSTVIDPLTYPDWAKAWGEGMSYEGKWETGEHVSFFDQSQGGTKVILEEVIPGEVVRMRHVAMVDPQNVERELTDDMMKKWLGSEENYFFKKAGDASTELEVVMVTDVAFEEMMNAWSMALSYLKEICER